MSTVNSKSEDFLGSPLVKWEKLQQIVVMKMPDILMLAKEPNNELSHGEMRQILLLILGCAIQCEKKEEFIEHIKELEVEVQRGLVASIQEITENPENVIPWRVSELNELSQEELQILSEGLYYQLQKVIEQRDDYVETILDLATLGDNQDDDGRILKDSPRVRRRSTLSPKNSFRSSNVLQANRRRVQNLQSELDDRVAFAVELKEEMEQMKKQLENLRHENKQLVSEAAWAKNYRDELDVLRSQLEQANKYQYENTKLKEKVRDLEYYKKQYEELKEESDMLYESKLLLEEKVAGSTSKISRFSHYQEENEKLLSQVKDLIKERVDDQQRIKDLVDEVAKLSMEKQESLSAYSVVNAELDGLRMQKQDDSSNVPLLVEYNQSSSVDVMQLERENEHLKRVVETYRTGAPPTDERMKDLEEDNQHLHEDLSLYKNMITKLTKSLLMERDSNRDLGDVINEQKENIKNLRGTLSRQNTELEQTTSELEQLTEELALKGIVIDPISLKEALDLNDNVGDAPRVNGNVKRPSSAKSKNEVARELPIQVKSEIEKVKVKLQEEVKQKDKEIQDIKIKFENVESFGKKVELQLKQREKDIAELERRFEKKITENKALNQNVVIQQDKVAALEERISHLMSSANEDTRKINKSLEIKMQRISDLETKLFQMEEDAKDHEKTKEKLQLADGKNQKIVTINKEYENKLREIELSFEKARNECGKLEHNVKLKDEKIATLETSLNEVTTTASLKQKERIELLVTSLNSRGSDIAELERKIEELILFNNKLKETGKTKNARIQDLEERISDLEAVNKKQTQSEKVSVLNKQLTDREGQIDELEVKLDESTNNCNKLKRTLQIKEDRLKQLEEKLQDYDDLSHQKEKLSIIAEDRSKKIIDIETKFDLLQNENSKLQRAAKQREEELKSTMKNLITLEASITDQSSLSKLLQIRDNKIQDLERQIDEKDESIVNLENNSSDLEGKVKKLSHALRIKEEKIDEIEQSLEKQEELEAKANKMQAAIAQKDNKIILLEDSLDQLNETVRQNARLKESVNTKEDKIFNLEQRIDDLEEAVKMNERLNQQVKQKEERIQTLQERAKDLENQLHKEEQRIDLIKKNAEKEIRRLSEQNEELSEVKVKRQMSLLRRDQKIVNLESRLNEFASERQQKDSKIQDLQIRLEGTMSQFRKLDLSKEEKDAKLQDLEARVKELQDTYKENRKLLRALQKKEEELEHLKKRIEDLNITNNENTALLNNKDKNISELQNRLEETLSLNNRLDLSIKKQKDEINSLEESIQSKEIFIEKLSNESLTKERLIERVKQKTGSLEVMIDEKQKEIDELEKRITKLPQYEKEKNELLNTVKEKNNLLDIMQSKLVLLESTNNANSENIIQMKDEQFNKLQKKLDELSKEKHKNILDIQGKDGVIAELQRRISELELTATDSDKLNVIVKEKNSQIKVLREDLEEYQQIYAQLERKSDELTSEVNRSSLAMKQKDERLKTLKSQLDFQRSLTFASENNLKLKEEKINSLEASLQEMKERNGELEEDINMLEKDLQELKKTGSLKNITNITEKIQLTKRARTELHIQRGPKMSPGPRKIEIKMSPQKDAEFSETETELIERLREDNHVLEKQKSHLSNQLDSISNENNELLSINESLQSDFDLLKVDYEEIQKEMIEAKQHFQDLDISATKIAHRCEVLVQLNATLEEENKALMDQVNKLLAQNQELLMTTLHSREQYLDDERAFSDHIYGLEREREKLSEKVLAAEKALMDSTPRKKSALWRGTHKILKKAGLSKKKENTATFYPDPEDVRDPVFNPLIKHFTTPKDFTATPPKEETKNPMGPIRGLLSRSRQDLSKIDADVAFKKPLESASSSGSDRGRANSDYYPPYKIDLSSPLHQTNNLYRVHSSESVVKPAEESTLSNTPEDDTDIVPFNRHPSNRSERPEKLERSKTPLSTIMNSSGSSSIQNTPVSSRRTSGASSSIQRVRVTTGQVMKSSAETVNMDYVTRQQLEQSPRSLRKNTRTTAYNNTTPPYTSPNHDRQPGRSSVGNTPSFIPIQNRATDRNGEPDPYDKINNNQRAHSRSTSHSGGSFDNHSIRTSSEISNDEFNISDRSDSFSPPSITSPRSQAFGSHEMRSSIRRYEMENMEPRPLPANEISPERKRKGSLPATKAARGSLVDQMKQEELFYGTKEQRSSIRSQKVESRGLQRSNSEKKKKNSSWYEYGNV